MAAPPRRPSPAPETENEKEMEMAVLLVLDRKDDWMEAVDALLGRLARLRELAPGGANGSSPGGRDALEADLLSDVLLGLAEGHLFMLIREACRGLGQVPREPYGSRWPQRRPEEGFVAEPAEVRLLELALDTMAVNGSSLCSDGEDEEHLG